MDRYLFIAVGAAIGGVLRYAVGTAIQARGGMPFPLGTMAVNVTGCFFIGLLLTLLNRAAAHPGWSLFLVTGLLGGYTTFSSFGWETYVLLRDGRIVSALCNSAASVVLGLIAVWLGVQAAKLL